MVDLNKSTARGIQVMTWVAVVPLVCDVIISNTDWIFITNRTYEVEL